MATTNCVECNYAIPKGTKFCGSCGADNSDQKGKLRKTSSGDLGADAMAIINAINGNTDQKVGELSKEVKTMGKDVEQIKSDVANTNTRLDTTNERLDKSDKRIDALEQRMKSNVKDASNSIQFPDVPRNKRTTVVVGGYAKDTDKNIIEASLKSITADCQDDVRESYCPGKLCGSIGKIDFKDNDKMWKFLKAHKGKKFQHEGGNLWHKVHQNLNERILSKRVMQAVALLAEHLVSKGICTNEDIKKYAYGDGDRGTVFYTPPGSKQFHRVFESKPDCLELQEGPGSQASGLDFDFQDCLSKVNAE